MRTEKKLPCAIVPGYMLSSTVRFHWKRLMDRIETVLMYLAIGVVLAVRCLAPFWIGRCS